MTTHIRRHGDKKKDFPLGDKRLQIHFLEIFLVSCTTHTHIRVRISYLKFYSLIKRDNKFINNRRRTRYADDLGIR